MRKNSYSSHIWQDKQFPRYQIPKRQQVNNSTTLTSNKQPSQSELYENIVQCLIDQKSYEAPKLIKQILNQEIRKRFEKVASLLQYNKPNNLESGVSKILKKVETSKSKTPKKNKTPKKGINMVTPEIQLKELRQINKKLEINKQKMQSDLNEKQTQIKKLKKELSKLSQKSVSFQQQQFIRLVSEKRQFDEMLRNQITNNMLLEQQTKKLKDRVEGLTQETQKIQSENNKHQNRVFLLSKEVQRLAKVLHNRQTQKKILQATLQSKQLEIAGANSIIQQKFLEYQRFNHQKSLITQQIQKWKAQNIKLQVQRQNLQIKSKVFQQQIGDLTNQVYLLNETLDMMNLQIIQLESKEFNNEYKQSSKSSDIRKRLNDVLRQQEQARRNYRQLETEVRILKERQDKKILKDIEQKVEQRLQKSDNNGSNLQMQVEQNYIQESGIVN